ncbi:hypothetical protein IWX90DRAFT_160101 [Phyllosticta citrichinensis]|uniref:Secreted protein n=1 Tax=Phyllosticta citrichinensis TaxID=1130410 RepID=A0ABR1Y095_9PEZI
MSSIFIFSSLGMSVVAAQDSAVASASFLFAQRSLNPSLPLRQTGGFANHWEGTWPNQSMHSISLPRVSHHQSLVTHHALTLLNNRHEAKARRILLCTRFAHGSRLSFAGLSMLLVECTGEKVVCSTIDARTVRSATLELPRPAVRRARCSSQNCFSFFASSSAHMVGALTPLVERGRISRLVVIPILSYAKVWGCCAKVSRHGKARDWKPWKFSCLFTFSFLFLCRVLGE